MDGARHNHRSENVERALMHMRGDTRDIGSQQSLAPGNRKQRIGGRM